MVILNCQNGIDFTYFTQFNILSSYAVNALVIEMCNLW